MRVTCLLARVSARAPARRPNLGPCPAWPDRSVAPPPPTAGGPVTPRLLQARKGVQIPPTDPRAAAWATRQEFQLCSWDESTIPGWRKQAARLQVDEPVRAM